MLEKSPKLSSRLIGAAATFILVSLLALYLVWERPTAITISANTELGSITIDMPDGTATSPLHKIEFTNEGVTQQFENVRIAFLRGTQLTLRREYGGPLWLETSIPHNSPDTNTANILLSTGEVIEIQGEGFLSVPLNTDGNIKSFYLAFEGPVIVGGIVRPRSSGFLVDGEVSITEKPLLGNLFGEGGSLLSDVPYIVSRVSLDPGDRVQFISSDGNDIVARGAIIAGPTGRMQMVAHAKATAVKVDRFGSAGYSIRPTLTDRIMNEPLFILLSVLLGLTLLVLQVFSPNRS